nr:protein SIEVE ELEMENT OCCLUSION B-like [Ipomoea batatas]
MATQPLSPSRTTVSQLQITHVEEEIIIEQVKDTHNPNGGIDVDANCLLKFVEDIFNFNAVSREEMQERLHLQEHIQKEISFDVLQLSFVIAFTCVSYDDSHSTAIYLLSLLSKYMWHAKGVMLLACFAIIRGKSKVASQSCHRKGLSYNMASLRNSLNSMLFPDNENFFNDSMRSMFNLTKLMVELRHSSSMFLGNYWIARCVVASAHLFILGLKPQNQIMAELSNVSTKIKEILASSLPLLDEFEGEGVLLLISSGKHFPCYAYAVAHTGVKMIWVPIINDLDEHIQISHSFISYRVLDPQKWIAPEFVRFLKDSCFSTFEVGCDPIVISLDKRGRLVHSNALHMILTWRSQIYDYGRTMRSSDIIPSLENELRERTLGADRVIDDIDKQIHNFAREVRIKIKDWVDNIEANVKSSFRSYNYTYEREQSLWDKESWNLKLVVGRSKYWNFQQTLNDWMDDDEKYIFLCGGNNIKRVLEFVLKMFWARLHSVASSRIQYLSKIGVDEGSDEILQGLRKLLSYEDECTAIGSWALLSKGKRIIACDMGDKMLGVLNEYEKWKNNAHANGFEQAFKDYYEMLKSSSSHQRHCCALNYSSNLDKISKALSCPQSNQNMHKFVTFFCCHGPTNYLYYEEEDEDWQI